MFVKAVCAPWAAAEVGKKLQADVIEAGVRSAKEAVKLEQTSWGRDEDNLCKHDVRAIRRLLHTGLVCRPRQALLSTWRRSEGNGGESG